MRNDADRRREEKAQKWLRFMLVCIALGLIALVGQVVALATIPLGLWGLIPNAIFLIGIGYGGVVVWRKRRSAKGLSG